MAYSCYVTPSSGGVDSPGPTDDSEHPQARDRPPASILRDSRLTPHVDAAREQCHAAGPRQLHVPGQLQPNDQSDGIPPGCR